MSHGRDEGAGSERSHPANAGPKVRRAARASGPQELCPLRPFHGADGAYA